MKRDPLTVRIVDWVLLHLPERIRRSDALTLIVEKWLTLSGRADALEKFRVHRELRRQMGIKDE